MVNEFNPNSQPGIFFEEVDEAKSIIGFGKGIRSIIQFQLQQRFDKGIGILTEHTGLFHGFDNKLDGMGDTLNSINDKLDTLPERIAEAMKK